MKTSISVKIHKRMTRQDKFYGLTTLGARGQLVIPAEARADLGLKPGTRLVVMGKFGKLLGLLKADELESFVETLMGNLAGSGMETHIRKHFAEFIKKARH